MAIGVYISIPFCRSKCSYCNFSSAVFSRDGFQHYLDRLSIDMENAPAVAEQMGGRYQHVLDSIYLGGGTPSVLDVSQLQQLFVNIRQNFDLEKNIEITVECAPGTLTPARLDALCRGGVNRVSLGVQSFVDREAAAVGRLHKRTTVLQDIRDLRAAGITNINIDLIAGLPHQTSQSWNMSLAETIGAGIAHVSAYMLEVDEDSRLGRELMAGGTRYHAHFVPDDGATADFYLDAGQRFEAAGISQYEISNFARPGFESRHNLKYWTRQPYLGLGVDAHSMLPACDDSFPLVQAAEGNQRNEGCEAVIADIEAVRFSTPDSLDDYLAGKPLSRTPVSRRRALEESFFLGLRLTRGIDLEQLQAKFGCDAISRFAENIERFEQDGLLERTGEVISLTARGRLVSNEVFESFIVADQTVI